MQKALLIVVILAFCSLAMAKYRSEYIQNPDVYQETSPERWAHMKTADLPNAFDWSNVNGTSFVTKSFNQHIPQYCGSCWAWGSTSAVSDRLKIARGAQGPDYILSVQYILNNNFGGSCYGGDHTSLYQAVLHKAWPFDTCQQYLACSSDSSEGFCSHVDTTPSPMNTCRTCATFGVDCKPIEKYPNVTISKYGTVYTADLMKKEILANGPIPCGINAEPVLNYPGGVFDDPSQGKQVNHIISVIGWGFDESSQKQYWIVRNSWGEYWGEMGYMKLAMGENQLGIEQSCAWADIESYSTNNFPCGEGGDQCDGQSEKKVTEFLK